MRWPQDAAGWPLAEHSRMVLHRPHRWHVQEIGVGPLLLFLHGAGGSTHSWRDLLPLFAPDYRCVAIDLPGQGFSRCGARDRCGLNGMAEDIAALAQAEGWVPAAVIGHSAGAAIALQLQRIPGFARCDVVGINAALALFEGVAGWLFPKLAKALEFAPFTADLFSATAGNAANVRKLIAGTGSHLSPEGLAYYERLLRDRDHVGGALAMMARWTLDDLMAALDRIDSNTLLLVGDDDRAVPPSTSLRAAEHLPHASVRHFAGKGHLLHEETPGDVVEVIIRFLRNI